MLYQVEQQRMGEIYSDHHAWLNNWFALRLGSRNDADDLVQDAFTRILGQRPNILNTMVLEEPRAYLTTVAKRVLANWYNRKALEQAYLEALALLPEPEIPSVEYQYIVLETLQEIDAVLDALPPLVKQAFLLMHLEGLKYSEIAGRLSISLRTVKRYVKKAFLQCIIYSDE